MAGETIAVFPLTMEFRRGSKAVVIAGQWHQVGNPNGKGEIAFKATYKSRGEMALCAYMAGDRSPDIVAAAIEYWGSL